MPVSFAPSMGKREDLSGLVWFEGHIYPPSVYAVGAERRGEELGWRNLGKRAGATTQQGLRKGSREIQRPRPRSTVWH